MFRSTSLIFDFSLRRPLNKNIIFKCIRYLYVPLLWSIDGDLCINKIDPRTANFDSNRHVIRIVSWVIKRTWISGFGITPSKTVFATTTDVFEEKKTFHTLVTKWHHAEVRSDMYYWQNKENQTNRINTYFRYISISLHFISNQQQIWFICKLKWYRY